MTLVVDAGVALKWFLVDEPEAAQARAVVESGTPLVAPDILVAETCNAAWRLARLGRVSRDQVKAIATALPNLFEALTGAATLAPRAVAIAVEIDHPVYDCLYLALAEARQTKLVTADTRLIDKLRRPPWTELALPLAGYDGGA